MRVSEWEFLARNRWTCSIIAGAAPNSQQLYYAYTGNQTFVGYQNAIFDSVNNHPS